MGTLSTLFSIIVFEKDQEQAFLMTFTLFSPFIWRRKDEEEAHFNDAYTLQWFIASKRDEGQAYLTWILHSSPLIPRSYVLVQRECVVSPVNNRVCVEFIEMRFYVSSRKSANKRPRIYLFYQRYFSQNWLPGESIFDQKTSWQNRQNSTKLL